MIRPEQYRDQSAASPVTVILATPLARDLQYLRQIIDQHHLQTVQASTHREALAAISRSGATALICDESIPWRDLLSYLADDCDPPRVIVVASAPRNTLWAEVLSLGGFDVLSKPFNDAEVSRVLKLACARPPLRPPSRKPPVSDREVHVAGRSKIA